MGAGRLGRVPRSLSQNQQRSLATRDPGFPEGPCPRYLEEKEGKRRAEATLLPILQGEDSRDYSEWGGGGGTGKDSCQGGVGPVTSIRAGGGGGVRL